MVGHDKINRRVIFHIDLDSFFVSAERLQDSNLVGRPVAVGGSGRRGVLSSASYEARKFGVRSAMPTFKALQLCPELIIVPHSFGLYSKLSRQVFEIIESFSPVVETTSVDEGYVDMTGTLSLWGEPLAAAERIRTAIFEKTKLTCSIGIASNRLVAKVATDYAKPNGVHFVRPGTEAQFLAPLPAEKLPGCGAATLKYLHARGLRTLGDIQNYPAHVLESGLGSAGRYLHRASFGVGGVAFHQPAKTSSISKEETFDVDEKDPKEFEAILWQMCSGLARELRRDEKQARVLKLKLRYPPFETISRSRVLAEPSSNDNPLFQAARTLFFEHWDMSRPLRLVGVGFEIAEPEAQLDFFSAVTPNEEPFLELVPGSHRTEKLDTLKDAIRSRFGKNALKTGRDL